MDNNKLFNDFPQVSSVDWKEVIKKILKGKSYEDTLLWKTREGIDIEPFYVRDKKAGNRKTSLLSSRKTDGCLIGFHIDSRKSIDDQWSLAKEHGAVAFKINWPKEGLEAFQKQIKMFDGAELAQLNLDGCSNKEIQILIENWNNIEISNSLSNITIGFDPLKNYLRTGNWEESEKEDFSIYIKYHDFFKRTEGKIRPILADGAFFQNAGATITEELALTLSLVVEYLTKLGSSESSIKSLQDSFHINLCIGPDFHLELCKIRAFKVLWKNLMNAYGLKDNEIKFPLITSETATWNKATADSYNNLLRLTSEIMSGSLGGADCIYANNFDSTYQLPNENSQRLSLNLHLLLKHEASMELTKDTVGGSYYYEHITNELGRVSWSIFQEIEKEGGLINFAKSGNLSKLINEARDLKQKDFDDKRSVLIGVNKYQNNQEKIAEPLATEDDEKSKDGYFRGISSFRIAGKIENERIVDQQKNGQL